MEEKFKNLYRKIFTPIERRCSALSCRKIFYCTGNCPERRWSTSKEIGLSLKVSCYCKECLQVHYHDLPQEYREMRLKRCY